MSLFADTIAPVRRTRPDELFLVRLAAVPAADNPEANTVSGAFANCWVDADDLRSAEEITLDAISREGWEAQKFEQWSLVSRDTYEGHASRTPEKRRELVEHVEEAFGSGYCLVFYCWAPDAPDAADPD